ncbi:hypothetical protein HDU98_002541 [Podochytrium sp. JEL0797]|nr:hypothetical protein HDU98_002541 [Podochytrium sp. JEL0797]
MKTTQRNQNTNLILPVASAAAALMGILTYIYRNDPILTTGNTTQKRVHRVGGAIPFLGDAVTCTANMHRFHDFIVDMFETTNNEPWAMKIPLNPVVIVFNDPACLEYVLKTKFSVFETGPKAQNMLRDFLGHGIFNVDGQEWKSQRKLASTIFNVRNFKDFVEDVFSGEMELLSQVIREHIGSEREFDLQELLFRFTFDSFTKIGFGVEINTMITKGPVGFMDAFDAVQARCVRRNLAVSWEWEEYLSGEAKLQVQQMKPIHEFCGSVIEGKRSFGLGCSELLAERDLLALMMCVEGPDGKVPSDKDLVDYCLNFLLAGRDTTAVALTWSIFLIHQNPHVQHSFLQEITTILQGSAPTYEQIRTQMPYANAIFHETLRLYPSVPANMKQANTDTTLPDGTFVPKGCCVSWLPYAMGRTEAIWGPDAKEFRPERWLEMEKQP